MKKIIIFFAFISFAFHIMGQVVPHWEWARGGNNGGALTEVYNIATNPMGDVYSLGTYSDTLKFGSTILIDSLPYPHHNIFVSKYNSAGQFQWAITSEGNASFGAKSITSDLNGNLYIAGFFAYGSLIFGSDTLNNGPGDASFLVKYDSSGLEQWAKAFYGGNNASFGASTDLTGNVYITGACGAGATFGTTTLMSSGIFIVKIASSGNIIWATGNYGYGGSCYAIEADNFGRVYITGLAVATSVFGHDTVQNSGYFLAKYDSAGNEIWFRDATGAGSGISLASNSSGKIFVIGGYNTSIATFGTHSLYSSPISSSDIDMYIVQYDSSGTVDWAKGSQGLTDERAYTVAADGLGNAYVSGRLASPYIIFDNDTLNFPVGSPEPIYLVKYDLFGNEDWAISLSHGGDDWNGVAANNNGDVYFAGDYRNPTPFIIGHDSLLVGIHSTEYPFVAKLGECVQSTHSISPIACGSFTLNAQTYTTSGTYTQNLTSATSCDSILTIHLTINNVNNSVTQTGITLTADTAGIIYQWLDCSNGYAALAGETNQSFTPTVNGQYAVQVEVLNGCIDTSSCFTISNLSIKEQFKVSEITISPNPFTSFTTITFSKEQTNTSIKIFDVLGKEMMNDKLLIINGRSATLDMSNVAKGIYFVRIESFDGSTSSPQAKNVVNRKIVVQ